MKVIIIYGSANDKEFMKPAHTYLEEQGVNYEEHVISAHRNLPELIQFLKDLLLLGILFCGFVFAKIFHGVGMQMTSNGAGVSYKPGIPLNNDSQVIGDIGFHFNNSIQSASIFGVKNNKRSVLLNMSAGYRYELFKKMLVGVFRPVIILQGGGAADMYSFSKHDIIGDWIIIYAAGAGFQFYNGRNLNEIMLKINRNTSIEWSMAFQLAVYWK